MCFQNWGISYAAYDLISHIIWAIRYGLWYGPYAHFGPLGRVSALKYVFRQMASASRTPYLWVWTQVLILLLVNGDHGHLNPSIVDDIKIERECIFIWMSFPRELIWTYKLYKPTNRQINQSSCMSSINHEQTKSHLSIWTLLLSVPR